MTRNNMFSISSPPDFSVSSSFYPFHTRSLHLDERQGRRIRRPAGKMKEPRQHRPVFLSSSLCPIPVSLPSFMMCMFLTLSASCLHPLMAQVSSGVSHHRFLRSSSSSSTATSSSSSSGGIIIRNHSLFPTLPSSCPANCVCDATLSQKKRVSCTKGSLKQIPTDKMDEDTKVIIFSGPPDKPNDVTLGRIFVRLPYLEEITITHSSLPAIGDSSFWPGTNVVHLDLSNNRIRILHQSDFRGLIALQTLNLSENNLTDAPSAVFRNLRNLVRLDLSRNKFTKLGPRLFYELDKLEYLDLSENPLTHQPVISQETFKDLSSLKILKIEKSNTQSVSLETYKELPNLKELSLNDNKLSFIHAFEFHSLSSYLKDLYLDGNEIEVIRDNAFFGLRLMHLGLSRNRLTNLTSCVFCQLQVQFLDLSSNRFTFFQANLLAPLSDSLSVINAGTNLRLENPSSSISNLLSPLKAVVSVKVSFNYLNDSLPDTTFSGMTLLRSLDLSQNHFSNITSRLFKGLNSLESLDLSFNRMEGIDSEVLFALDSIPSLKAVYLQPNPWSCRRCRILPLMNWMSNRSPPSYFNVCLRNNAKVGSVSYHETSFNSLPSASSSIASASTSSATSNSCVICSSPEHLSGKALHSITEADLEYCPDPRIPMKLSSTESRVGLILGVTLILCLVLSIIVVSVMYTIKRKAAVYYTHEGDCCEFKATPSALNNHPYFLSGNHYHTIGHNHHHNRLTSSSSLNHSYSHHHPHSVQSLHRQNHHTYHHYHQDDAGLYTPHSRRHQRHSTNPLKFHRSCCSYSQRNLAICKKSRKMCATPSSSSSSSSYHRFLKLPKAMNIFSLTSCRVTSRRSSSPFSSSSPTFTCGSSSRHRHSILSGGRSPSFGQTVCQGFSVVPCTGGNNTSFTHDHSNNSSSADSPPGVTSGPCFTRKFTMNSLKSPFKCSRKKSSTYSCNSSSPLSEIDLNSSSSSPEGSPNNNNGARPKTRF